MIQLKDGAGICNLVCSGGSEGERGFHACVVVLFKPGMLEVP